MGTIILPIPRGCRLIKWVHTHKALKLMPGIQHNAQLKIFSFESQNNTLDCRFLKPFLTFNLWHLSLCYVLRLLSFYSYECECRSLWVIESGKVKNFEFGTSLAVQWLRLHASTAGAYVPFLIRELRSCTLHGMSKKTKQNNFGFLFFLLLFLAWDLAGFSGCF